MKKALLFAVLVVVALVAGIVLASDDRGSANDPRTNERANACYTGGSLEGQCHRTDADRDGDVDQLDIEFMWWCGWYIIRAERGIIRPTDAPEGCFREPVIAPILEALPAEPTPVATVTLARED